MRQLKLILAELGLHLSDYKFDCFKRIFNIDRDSSFSKEELLQLVQTRNPKWNLVPSVSKEFLLSNQYTNTSGHIYLDEKNSATCSKGLLCYAYRSERPFNLPKQNDKTWQADFQAGDWILVQAEWDNATGEIYPKHQCDIYGFPHKGKDGFLEIYELAHGVKGTMIAASSVDHPTWASAHLYRKKRQVNAVQLTEDMQFDLEKINVFADANVTDSEKESTPSVVTVKVGDFLVQPCDESMQNGSENQERRLTYFVDGAKFKRLYQVNFSCNTEEVSNLGRNLFQLWEEQKKRSSKSASSNHLKYLSQQQSMSDYNPLQLQVQNNPSKVQKGRF